MACSNTCERIALSRAAKNANTFSLNAINRYAIDQSHTLYAYPECYTNKQAVEFPTLPAF